MIVLPTLDVAVGDALLLKASSGNWDAVIILITWLEGDPFAKAVTVFVTEPASRSGCVI